MNKIYRKGFDLDVAFSTLAKTRAGSRGESCSTGDFTPDEQPSEVLDSVQNSAAGFRRYARLLLRKLATVLYRLLKPFIRPLAYRARAFLLNGIQQSTSGPSAQVDARLDQQMWHIVAIKEEIQHLRAEMQTGSMKGAAAVIQELQFMRELLEESIQEAHVEAAEKLANLESPLPCGFTGDACAQLSRIEMYAYSGARRFAVNCGDGDVLVRAEMGYILCHGSSDPATLSMLIESGDMERGTRLLIQRLLQPGDLFIDVGANLGLHTIAAARAMQGKGRIVAFEPFPGTARLLGLSALINGFAGIVEVRQAAVSTTTGMGTLYLGQVSGHHSLFPHNLKSDCEPKHIEVPLTRIDDVIDEAETVALIKIDVEGAELEVLRTAEATIQRNRDIAIIAEFGPSHLKVTGHDAVNWLASFTSLGMDWRVINPDTGVLESYSLEQLMNVHSANLLFARNGSPLLST